MSNRRTTGTFASRRQVLKWGSALGLAGALPNLGGFRAGVAAQEGDWAAPPDMAKAAEQAKEIVTYGIPDDWANYGEVFKAFQASLGVTDGTHVDTDMSSLQEITKFDDEKSNPSAMLADIGLLWGASPRSAASSRLTYRRPPRSCPRATRRANGGWVATFAGVPAFVVNLDALGAQVPTPTTGTICSSQSSRARSAPPAIRAPRVPRRRPSSPGPTPMVAMPPTCNRASTSRSRSFSSTARRADRSISSKRARSAADAVRLQQRRRQSPRSRKRTSTPRSSSPASRSTPLRR